MYKILEKIVLILIVAIGVQIPVWSQDGKVKVSVAHSGEDSVGRQFSFAVRETIRGSNGYQLVSDDQSGMHIAIVTINPDSSSGSNWTTAAITYTMTNFIPYQKGNPQTWYPIHLTSQVMAVGINRTYDQARSVLATLDAQLEQYRRDARK